MLKLHLRSHHCWLMVAAERTHLRLTQSVAGVLVGDGVPELVPVFGSGVSVRGSFFAHDCTCVLAFPIVWKVCPALNETAESFKSGFGVLGLLEE